MEWKELQTLVKRKIGYGIVQPGPSVQRGVPIIKVNNIISGLYDTKHLDKTTVENDAKYQRTKLKGGELIVTVVGTCGKTAIVPSHFAGCNLVRATCLIDIEDETICRWIKYYIDSPQGQAYINRNLNTTVQATLNVKNLNEMPIPFYSKEYTSNVVKILSSLDRKIELNNKINADLEEMAQAIFKNWFVDFEPFKDGKFVDSELGMIPEGWKVGLLGELCNFKRGKNLLTKNAIDEGVPVVAGGLEPSCYHNVANTGAPVITVSGSGANAGFMRMYHVPVWASDCSFIDISCENFYFVYCFLKVNSKLLKHAQTGAVQPHVKPSDIHDFELVIPDKESIYDFQDKVKPFFDKIALIQKENSRLSLLRDTLLPRLMSGELEVPE